MQQNHNISNLHYRYLPLLIFLSFFLCLFTSLFDILILISKKIILIVPYLNFLMKTRNQLGTYYKSTRMTVVNCFSCSFLRIIFKCSRVTTLEKIYNLRISICAHFIFYLQLFGNDSCTNMLLFI